MELEEEFDISIPDEAAEKIQKVGEAVEFIENAPEGRPVLVLEQGDEKKRLPQGRVIEETQRIGLLVFLADGTRYTVTKGADLDIMERKYKVIDILQDRVVIRDVETGKDTDVGRLTEDERAELLGESTPQMQPGGPPPRARPATPELRQNVRETGRTR